MFTVNAAVVYTIIGDIFSIRVVHVSGTGQAELVMFRAVSWMCSVTGIPGSRIQLLILFMTAYARLKKIDNTLVLY